jgi:hypothetical protein
MDEYFETVLIEPVAWKRDEVVNQAEQASLGQGSMGDD